MDLGPLKAIRDEWSVVKLAPWSFVIVAVVTTGIGFAVGTLWWSGTVSTLRERLAFAQDKLQVALANPANPGAALLTKPDSGRRLAAKEKECLISKFKDLTAEFKAIIVSAYVTDEAQRYATDFSTTFIRMGYQSGVLPGGPKGYDDIGVIVGFKDPENPSETGKKFKSLVGACVALNDRKLRWEPLPALLPQFSAIDFDLFVGPQD